jgi:hypothetical protein
MQFRELFAELKRRNVYKVAVVYAVTAWLLIQAASILLPTFEAPVWVMKVVVMAVVLGFPIALILAWAFELTPEGIKHTEDVDPFDSRSHHGGQAGQVLPAGSVSKNRAWIYVTIVGVFLSTALFLIGRYSAKPEASTSSLPEKSIAVLPVPVMLPKSVLSPIAVFPPPVSLFSNAIEPVAVLLAPVVLKRSAL